MISKRTLGSATDLRPCTYCKPTCIALATIAKPCEGESVQVWCAAFAAGSVLFSQGSASRKFFGICDGLVKLTIPLAKGSQRIVRLLGEGDVMGLEGLSDDTYHSSACAITSVRTYIIPTPKIKNWDSTLPHFHRTLLGLWLRSQDQANNIIAELATGTAKVRMAKLIVDFLVDKNSNGACLCHAPSRLDMADVLGLTGETASRIIASFKRQGLIGSESSHCFPCKLGELKMLAEHG